MARLVFAIMSVVGPRSGRTEPRSNSQTEGGKVKTLAIDPVNSAIIYAGTYEGVFRSTDGAAHQSLTNEGLAHTDVKKVAVDPVNPAILYAGAYGRVMKRVNGGANWFAVNQGLTR
jgi:hypothetical protein